MSLIVAHRGYSAIAPENTLASFCAAMEAGAQAAECDVHLTRDRCVVLSHDATLDRCTDGAGAIAALSLDEVQSVDAGSWKGEQYRGERVPTLAQALELMRGRMRLVMEIKASGIAQKVVETVRECGAIGEVTAISFSLETCRELRGLEPAIPVGFLTGGLREDTDAAADELIQTALSAHCQFLNVAHSGITPSLLRRAGLCGVSVWAWTVNDPGQVIDLARRGVAGITTDDPSMGLEAVR